MERSDNSLPLLPAYDIANDYQQCSEFLSNELRHVEAYANNNKDFFNQLNKLFNTWQ